MLWSRVREISIRNPERKKTPAMPGFSFAIVPGVQEERTMTKRTSRGLILGLAGAWAVTTPLLPITPNGSSGSGGFLDCVTQRYQTVCV